MSTVFAKPGQVRGDWYVVDAEGKTLGYPVYATIDGTLENVLPAGHRVTRGEAICQLNNTEVARELASVEGEYRLRKLRVEHLERLRGVDSEANDELPTARAALADAKRRGRVLRPGTIAKTVLCNIDQRVRTWPEKPSFRGAGVSN